MSPPPPPPDPPMVMLFFYYVFQLTYNQLHQLMKNWCKLEIKMITVVAL